MKYLWSITGALLLLNSQTQADQRFDPTSVDQRLTVPGGQLLIDWRSDFSPAQQEKLTQWMISMTNTASLLHGQLPRPEIRIAMQAYPARSAVPFARILRDEPQGVLFYINPEKPLDNFIVDWTAYHELSHLFIPYPGQPDLWFSEGLASYYQNILQYRAGLLSAEEAIGKLRAGFERGKADNRNADMTLTELSPKMRENLAFMRVYWSGALYFLAADLQLHERGTSLDDILREFGACCLAEQRDWTGQELAARFDAIAEAAIFIPLYDEYSQSTAIPAYEALLEAPEMVALLESERHP